jgi:YgiT-type zinc finger domain-containing protein
MAVILLLVEDDDAEYGDRCQYWQDGKFGRKAFEVVIMKCPCCGAAELISDTRDLPVAYRGESTVITGVTGDFCPACGEVVLSRKQGDRYSEALGDFHRRVDAAQRSDPASNVQSTLD